MVQGLFVHSFGRKRVVPLARASDTGFSSLRSLLLWDEPPLNALHDLGGQTLLQGHIVLTRLDPSESCECIIVLSLLEKWNVDHF